MKKEKEQRILSTVQTIHEENSKVIRGFIPYNSLSEDLGFREMISPSAFTKTINDRYDVLALISHDHTKVLGRVRNDSLKLESREDGLYIECILPENVSYARDAWELINSGYNTNMSFGFIPVIEEWITQDGLDIRVIKECKLLEVSFCVATPAYSKTDSSILRQLETTYEGREISEEDKENLKQLNERINKYLGIIPVDEANTLAVGTNTKATDTNNLQYYHEFLKALRNI